VAGVDLTPQYVQVATSLSRRTGLAAQTSFRQGSATDLPYADDSFDRAYLVHVGMNIEDKQQVFAEVRRVLTDDAVFGMYDVMLTGRSEVTYPLPWARTADISFLATAELYRTWLAEAGFTVTAETDRTESGVAFFNNMQAGPPPADPGLALALGADAAVRFRGMAENLQRGTIAPTEMICRTTQQ